ncbi:MAG: hypothetical protein HKN13_09035 [Rhodothermales bacterium]|nr:hypothetical protein [Rhodothermales bacterium]
MIVLPAEPSSALRWYAVAFSPSLILAIRKAASDIARWLESAYGLSPTEAALVMGTVD